MCSSPPPNPLHILTLRSSIHESLNNLQANLRLPALCIYVCFIALQNTSRERGSLWHSRPPSLLDRITLRPLRLLAMLIYLELRVSVHCRVQSRGIDVRADVVDPAGTRTTTRSLPILTRGSTVYNAAQYVGLQLYMSVSYTHLTLPTKRIV